MVDFRRVGLAVLSASAVAVGGLAGTSQAAPVASSPNVSNSVTAGEAQSAVRYWTTQRMATAKQADVGAASTRSRAAVADATVGKPVTVSPTAGTAGPSSDIEPMHASSVSRPYTNLPDRLNGKVFFTKATGGNFVCSATVVNSDNKDMVDTAGHCVSDGTGRFHLNWVFVPGYSSACNGCGDRPYGTWTARTLTTTTEWHNFSNLEQDLGYGVLNTLGGQHIVNRLGGQGSAFNRSRSQIWNAYGYPQAAPFNGFNQYVCVSGRLADDNPTPRVGPLTIRIHCNMTGGSSGGGWLIQQSGGLGFVNSHNSYKYVSGPLANSDHMYGPFYGNQALSLFNFSKGL
jgi:hypothetical protein